MIVITVIYILIALLLFGTLVLVHEGGHFFAARLCKIRVKEFSIGMGPKIISKVSEKSSTKYSLGLLPIGGYVAMDDEDDESDDPDAFCNKSVPKRLFVIVAGAFMNILMGLILTFALVLSQGTLLSNTIGSFDEGAVSAQKLQINDEVLKIGNTRVHTGNEIVYEIMNQGDKPIDILVLRNGEEILVEDVVFQNDTEDGIVFGKCDFNVYHDEHTFGNYLTHTFCRFSSTVKMIFDTIANIVTGKYGIQAVSGPIGVTQAVGTAVSLGFSSVLYFVTYISINLGIFNLLPFPALDGGRILFLAIEGVRGKPLNRKFEAYVNFAGIMILFAFMIFVSLMDVWKLIF